MEMVEIISKQMYFINLLSINIAHFDHFYVLLWNESNFKKI